MSEITQEEIQGIANSLVGETAKAIEEKFVEIQRQLDEKWKEGLSPADDRVRDLEKVIVEYEERVKEIESKHTEEIRLIKSEFTMIGHGITRAEGGPIDPMRVDYGGEIMSREQMRAIVGKYSPDAQRAATGDFTTISPTIDVLGGKLSPERADRFIDLIVQEQAMLSRITTRRMLSPEVILDQLQVGARTMRTPTEGADTGHGVGVVTFPSRPLTTTEVSVEHDITLSWLEDNIERANGEAHVTSGLARAFGSDSNDLAVNGSEGAGGTPAADAAFIGLKDGFMKIVDGLTYDGVGANPVADQQQDLTGVGTATLMLAQMHRAIPDRYKARTDYLYFVPTGTAEIYADETRVRETALGDSVLVEGFPNLRYFGRPVIPEPRMSQATGTLTGIVATEDMMLLAPREVLVWGVHRNFRVDGEFRPRKRAVEYTMSTRLGFQVSALQTHVHGTNIPAALR